MAIDAVRNDFASRMQEVCARLKIPSGHGQQAALGRRFGVTSKAARKWLTGASLPELSMAIRIADEAGVTVIWLLQGAGPRDLLPRETKIAEVAEGISELPDDDRQGVLDFVRYKFERADGWFANDRLSRYMKLLDQLSKPPGTGS